LLSSGFNISWKRVRRCREENRSGSGGKSDERKTFETRRGIQESGKRVRGCIEDGEVHTRGQRTMIEEGEGGTPFSRVSMIPLAIFRETAREGGDES